MKQFCHWKVSILLKTANFDIGKLELKNYIHLQPIGEIL